MALPTAKDGTEKIIKYAAEVGGICLGFAACPELIPDATKRLALTEAGNRIVAGVRGLGVAWSATVLYEFLEQRINLGRGVGLDRGWDRTVVRVSEGAKNAVPDRNAADPAYRTVFEGGTIEKYTKPGIKQDDGLATELRTKVEHSGLSNSVELIALIDGILPLVGEGARTVRDGEQHINDLFKDELKLRGELADLLWTERKNVEGLLGRSGRALAKIIFFDFGSRSPVTIAVETLATDTGTPATPDSETSAAAPGTAVGTSGLEETPT